ncbi:hypothetical protein NG798_21115 [Ancylothrix sp. C2]|uniref:hypothetical protein n=1 Tax=Ancylothrix sp. D3o TaxID=2953691 RepID=UPI0021BBAE88|nr:hypothetical protein [Ancylothrix sp. D3o]MCT7952301.1 hypothetical protein [Ancylothrix sp. D3o]
MTKNNPQNTPDKSTESLQKIKPINIEQQYTYWQEKTEILRKKQQNLRRESLSTGQILPFLEPQAITEKCKLFDCVEMKYKAVQQILKKINNMTTIEEELAYWEKSTEKLRSRQQAFRRPKNLQ